jgi:hypothetical protein
MKLLIIIFFLSQVSFAGNNLFSTISKIENDEISSRLHRIYLSTGEIVKSTNLKLVNELKNHFLNNHLLSLQIDSEHQLTSVQIVAKVSHLKPIPNITEEDYAPSELSENQTIELFKSFRKGARGISQCYNRAHIWVYESKKSFDINSMKVFLFFTKKFIREHDYRWWFHVAPGTYTQKSPKNYFSVIDPYFADSPLPLTEWSHLFVPKKTHCPEINQYSEFDKHQEEESCYFLKTSMYYLQPLDLKELEERSEIKNTWEWIEIKRAYRNGFGIWNIGLFDK